MHISLFLVLRLLYQFKKYKFMKLFLLNMIIYFFKVKKLDNVLKISVYAGQCTKISVYA